MALIIDRYLLCDFRISQGCLIDFGTSQSREWKSNKQLLKAAKSAKWKVSLTGCKHICPACQELRRRQKGIVV